MDEQLRKRLEEAAENFTKTDNYFLALNEQKEELEYAFKEGGEWMFKECGGMTVLHDMRRLILAQAKEWLFENYDVYGADKLIIASFEAYMRNLWEEKK